MKKIVGLRNPDKKYQFTRHNTGEIILELIKEREGFPNFKKNKRYGALVSKGFFEEEFLMVLPNTFMNSSGKAIKKIIKNPDNLWIIHDDISISLGKIKISKGKGAGGHKGVQSIIDEIKTQEFVRLRVGIQPSHPVASENLPNFVLQKFTKKELKEIEKASVTITEIIKLALKESIEKAMSKFNQND